MAYKFKIKTLIGDVVYWVSDFDWTKKLATALMKDRKDGCEFTANDYDEAESFVTELSGRHNAFYFVCPEPTDVELAMADVAKYAVSVVSAMKLMGATSEHIKNALGAIYEGVKDKCEGYTLTRFLGDVYYRIKANKIDNE